MTKKFERVLTEQDLVGIFWRCPSSILGAEEFKQIAEMVEQATITAFTAHLEKQEPVAIVSKETFSNDGTSDIITSNLPIGTPLYTHPCVSPASGKTACVSENGESDRQLARLQPCGCVVCYCENQERCLGCGAKYCGTHDVGETPNPVYVDHIADASKMVGSDHIPNIGKMILEADPKYTGEKT